MQQLEPNSCYYQSEASLKQRVVQYGKHHLTHKTAYIYSILVTQIRLSEKDSLEHMHIRKKRKGWRAVIQEKGESEEKGQSEKECEIKRVKDRLDKQKKSQLHTRREQYKTDEKTLMKKIRCILKVKKTANWVEENCLYFL